MTDPTRRAIEEAWALCDLRRFEDAAALARRALASSPTDLDALGILTEALLGCGRPAEALPIAERYLALAPESAVGFELLGWSLHKLGKHESAVDAMREATRRDPAHAMYRVMLTESLLSWRKWMLVSAGPAKKAAVLDEATAMAAEAVRLDPTLAATHAAQALVAEYRGDLDDASAAALRALALDPNNHVVRNLLGIITDRQGDVVAAADHHLASARAEPRSQLGLHNLRRLGGDRSLSLSAAAAVVAFGLMIAIGPGEGIVRALLAVAIGVLAAMVPWSVVPSIRMRRVRRALSPEATEVLRRDAMLSRRHRRVR
jgi:tetratricopeptide (TPR) repeat protein